MYFRILSSIYSCLCSHPLTSAGREAVPLNPLLHTSVCSALSLPLWSIDRPRPVANGIQKTSGSLSRSYLFVTFFVLPLLLISSPPALREIAIPPFDRPLLQSPTLSLPLHSGGVQIGEAVKMRAHFSCPIGARRGHCPMERRRRHRAGPRSRSLPLRRRCRRLGERSGARARVRRK